MGTEIPQLKNKYIFGDIPRGTLFFSELSNIIKGQQAPVFRMDLELNGDKIELANMAPNSRVDFRLGKDSFGEILIFTKSNGKVYRIVDCKLG